MTTRITMMLVLAAACAMNTGCACMDGCGSYGSSSNYGCASCGMAEASCCCPDPCCDDASCGLPDASCGCSDVASCGLPEASCCCPDASCGCPTDTCTTSVGCGSPVVGQCRLLQRIGNAFRGRSNCNNGCSSEAYWSEWHNDPPCDCPSCSPHASAGRRGQYYSSAARRRSRLSEQGVDIVHR